MYEAFMRHLRHYFSVTVTTTRNEIFSLQIFLQPVERINHRITTDKTDGRIKGTDEIDLPERLDAKILQRSMADTSGQNAYNITVITQQEVTHADFNLSKVEKRNIEVLINYFNLIQYFLF